MEQKNTQPNPSNKPLTKKQKFIYLSIAVLVSIGAFLSPVISPYLISWIDFNGAGWKVAETVVGILAFLALLIFVTWFAIDSVKSLKHTLSEIFDK